MRPKSFAGELSSGEVVSLIKARKDSFFNIFSGKFF